MRRLSLGSLLAAGLLFGFTGFATAQRIGTGSTGGTSSTGSGSSSFGGTSGSSSFGSGGFGSSSFSSTFGGMSGTGGTGSTGFGGTGSTGGFGSTGRTGGTSTFNSASPFASTLGNPLSAGAVGGGNTRAQTSASGNYVRTLPFPVVFGQPVYGTANLTTTANQGTTALGTAGGLGGASNLATQRGVGANSAGIRRAPAYIAEPVFDVPAKPSMDVVRADLQGIIARSTRLPSRENIQVINADGTIVLRGEVRDEREARLAEGLVRLSPGVRSVKNELVARKR